MQAHPPRLVLRKIASRRRRAPQIADRDTLAAFVSGTAIDPLSSAFRAGPLGPRLLTRREEQVLRLVARGETDRSIADRLYVSRRTINSHVSNILAKLDVPSRREAVVTAVRLGLL